MNRDHVLDSRNAEAVRKLLASEGANLLSLQDFAGWTLPGMIELYSSLLALPKQGGKIRGEIVSGEQTMLEWSQLHSTWNGDRKPALPQGAELLPIDFFRVDSEAVVNGESFEALCFSGFQQRLVRASKNVGFQPGYSRALAGVMLELVENVLQHSRVSEAGNEHALVAYHTTPNYLAFSISDLGVGLLTSLRSSTTWAELSSDEAALKAIVRHGASRKDGLGEGEGFKQLFKALVDRSANIRIRTGTAAVDLGLNDEAERVAEYSSSPHLAGVQISLVCSTKEDPSERVIRKSLTK